MSNFKDTALLAGLLITGVVGVAWYGFKDAAPGHVYIPAVETPRTPEEQIIFEENEARIASINSKLQKETKTHVPSDPEPTGEVADWLRSKGSFIGRTPAEQRDHTAQLENLLKITKDVFNER